MSSIDKSILTPDESQLKARIEQEFAEQVLNLTFGE